MSAGQPDWNRLYQLGKLPKGQFFRINGGILSETMDKLCDECRTLLFPEIKPKKKEIKEPKEKTSDKSYEQKCEKCEMVFSGNKKSEILASYDEHLKIHEIK